MITSLDVGGQSDKLMKPLPLKVVAEGVGLGGADIDVTNDQSVFFWVNEVLQMVCCTMERLILGPVNVDDTGCFF